MGSWVQEGTCLKIENGDDPIYFFKYLTGYKFAFIDVSLIRMRNKIISKLIDCNNTSYGWFYGKKLHPKR